MDYSTWEKLEQTAPEEAERIAEAICEAIIGHYQGYAVEGVRLRNVHQKDACNHVADGDVDVELEDGTVASLGFVAASGNMAGFEMLEWGEDAGLYEPPPPTVYRCIPVDWMKWPAYEGQRKAGAFDAIERGYAYDRHFAPGEKTSTYYREAAAKLDCRIGTHDDLVEGRKRALEYVRAHANPAMRPLADIWEREWK